MRKILCLAVGAALLCSGFIQANDVDAAVKAAWSYRSPAKTTEKDAKIDCTCGVNCQCEPGECPGQCPSPEQAAADIFKVQYFVPAPKRGAYCDPTTGVCTPCEAAKAKPQTVQSSVISTWSAPAPTPVVYPPPVTVDWSAPPAPSFAGSYSSVASGCTTCGGTPAAGGYYQSYQSSYQATSSFGSAPRAGWRPGSIIKRIFGGARGGSCCGG